MVSVSAWSDKDVWAALEDVYRHVIEQVDAGRALQRTLLDTADTPRTPIHLLAVGKAAPAMADAATGWLRRSALEPAQVLVVGSRGVPSSGGTSVVAGDHPLPAAGSIEAAGAVTRFVDRVAQGDTVWLLLSGGASSMMASPVAGVSFADLVVLFDRLHATGLDIHTMNTVRKRFLMWGAGRLAQALAHATCQAFVVSDVPGDSVASIGSGPVSPDETTVTDVREILDRTGLLDRLPHSLQANIAGIEAGEVPETAKPGDPVFHRVTFAVVASNHDAVKAAEAWGRAHDWTVQVEGPFLTGEASTVGQVLGSTLVGAAAERRDTASLFVWGGETVVKFESPPTALGGRCQELALAAARELSAAKVTGAGLLAAGTDGRDGPTDAAGAIVTAGTWAAMQAAGVDPGQALSQHASYQALASAEALFAPGLTGTNVMDIVVGIVAPKDQGRNPAAGR